jgi:processive 1,2-diacylglycerol beta-glucosyltransferase
MDQYMAASDLFIGKPGGLSSSECLARSLPMILWDPIPGQEVFNSVFLLEHAAAVAPTAGATLGYKVDAILQDPDRLAQMKRSARAVAKPAAAQTIVETLLATHRQPPLLARRP